MRSRAVIAGIALALAAAVSPATASATTGTRADCGETLTTDAYLAADLTCPGDGVRIAGDIHLDLHGHTLRGAGVGILVVGDASPTITNGRIDGWRIGIGGDQTAIEDSRIERIFTVTRVTFTHNADAVEVSNTGRSFGLETTTDFVIAHSRFINNTDALAGSAVGRLDVSTSLFSDNGRAVSVDTGNGIDVEASQIVRNGTSYLCMEVPTGCTLAYSTLVDNRAGMAVINARASLSRNQISGSDVAVSGTVSRLVLNGNVLTNNTTAVQLNASGATLTGNLFRKNGIGFTTLFDDSDATLDHNIFVQNNDGIFVEEAAPSLRRNIAVHNARWGIYAPHATDLGGNRASANGSSPDCIGVAC